MNEFENTEETIEEALEETFEDTNDEVVDEVVEATAEESVEEAFEDVVEESDEPTDEPAEEAPKDRAQAKDPVLALTDELMKASRLLRQRRRAMHDESRANEERDAARLRALKLLDLKPGMNQKELAELMGERLRLLDEMLAEMETQGLVEREQPEEPDMRAVAATLTDAGKAAIIAGVAPGEAPQLAPDFSAEDLAALTILLAKLNASFEALGLHDEDRRERAEFGDRRGGRDDRRGGRDDRRGGRDDRRGGRDDRRGPRGGRGGYQGGYHAPGHDGTRNTQAARYDHKDRRYQDNRGRKGFGNRGGRGFGSSN
jgi:DNA-binding MarR family transcriptional regulator